MKPTEKLKRPGECHAYLVRIWRDSPEEPWRASAKQVSTGRQFHFASPEKLFLFLHDQTNYEVIGNNENGLQAG